MGRLLSCTSATTTLTLTWPAMGAPGTVTVPHFARLLQPRSALAVRRHVALRLTAFATGCPGTASLLAT
eukprot:3657095-Lingulodinium_polyedra.AAC.1